ncbi:MAG: LuxR C-terminal-related transcriptional regulator [Candidatus Cybelea sp.]
MIASRLLEADLLYQMGAVQLAAERLEPLARETTPESTRLAAFCRLTEIACDRGELAGAQRSLSEMNRSAERLDSELTLADRAELTYAAARYAFSRRDGPELARLAHDALLTARQASQNDRISSLAIRINSYLAVDRYHRRDLTGAAAAAATAIERLQYTPSALQYVKTHALTTRAVIDLHDPARAHLAAAENVEALKLALAAGMIATARDALFNIANSWLFCDDSVVSLHETSIVRTSLEDALVAPSRSDDPVLAALALCSCGRYSEAAEVIERIGPPTSQRSSDWLPIFFGPVTATKHARILFKAGKFEEADRTAAEALKAWEQSRLGGDGTALRVRAEALEALGETNKAIGVIEEALDALEPIKPIHHLVGAYQCAHRLTKKRTYLDNACDLAKTFKRVESAPHDTRLTPREYEIALLVAQGESNKSIAARLRISSRTVDNHVASIFGRLSVRGRWQLTTDLVTRAPRV